MKFTKMQGLGNDYVYVDCIHQDPGDLNQLAARLSERHFGVGSDGLICICPSDWADFRMRMFNADGTEGEMCGNGIRCLGKFVYDKGLTDKTELVIETLGGERKLFLTVENGEVSSVTVDMGVPVIEAVQKLTVKGVEYTGTPVSMGNPHFVVEVADPMALDLPDIGPAFEYFSYFPNRTNTEFVRPLAENEAQMRVWERGSGETLACGTGACAAVAAAYISEYTGPQVHVILQGGELDVEVAEDNHIYMTGPATIVFEGEIDL